MTAKQPMLPCGPPLVIRGRTLACRRRPHGACVSSLSVAAPSPQGTRRQIRYTSARGQLGDYGRDLRLPTAPSNMATNVNLLSVPPIGHFPALLAAVTVEGTEPASWLHLRNSAGLVGTSGRQSFAKVRHRFSGAPCWIVIRGVEFVQATRGNAAPALFRRGSVAGRGSAARRQRVKQRLAERSLTVAHRPQEGFV